MRRPLLVCAILFATACGKSNNNTTPPDAGPKPLTPALDAGAWNEIATGGDTICARGGPYSFFVYPGTQNKVVIDFMGGGACWTDTTCSFAGSLFDDSVDSLRQRVKNGFPGIYDKTNQASPVKDWYHVVVPYCTGDIHWGDNVVTYGNVDAGEFTINHKGAVNTQAVLNWVYDNFPRPEQILVQGCSAGSYGSIMWSAHIHQHYPNVPIRQFGDSGAGIVTGNFFHDSFPSWNATAAAPAFIPTLDPAQVDWSTLALPDLYERIGAYYPEMPLTQFNFAFDGTQTFFYTAMGGNGPDWSPAMFNSIQQIHTNTPNFFSFIAPGTQHCVITDDDFTTVSSNGTSFLSWYTNLESNQPIQNVQCVDCDGGS
jgi:hypothetical protein